MLATAKVFNTGNSQAIRLPKAFRVNVQEMWIARNEVTGEITLKPKPAPDELEAFFAELKAMPVTQEFLQPRDDAPRSNPLEDWAA
jgi:antitoxin VapB